MHAIFRDGKTEVLFLSKLNNQDTMYYRLSRKNDTEYRVELFDSWTFEWNEVFMTGPKKELTNKVKEYLKALGHDFKVEVF